MWVPNRFRDWFQVSKDTVDRQREELAKLNAENQLLRTQLITTDSNFKWICTRVNALEVERAQLLEKAYGVKVIVPEIVRTPQVPIDLNASIFEDLGDKVAKELGLPVYNQ